MLGQAAPGAIRGLPVVEVEAEDHAIATDALDDLGQLVRASDALETDHDLRRIRVEAQQRYERSPVTHPGVEPELESFRRQTLDAAQDREAWPSIASRSAR